MLVKGATGCEIKPFLIHDFCLEHTSPIQYVVSPAQEKVFSSTMDTVKSLILDTPNPKT